MADRETIWRITGSAVVAVVVVALGAPSALAGGGEEPANEPPPPPSGYECPLPPGLNPIGGPGPRNPFDARELKGLKMPHAKRVAAKHDCSVRVVRRNGEDLAITEDYSPQRINVGVQDGRVRRIHGIF